MNVLCAQRRVRGPFYTHRTRHGLACKGKRRTKLPTESEDDDDRSPNWHSQKVEDDGEDGYAFQEKHSRRRRVRRSAARRRTGRKVRRRGRRARRSVGTPRERRTVKRRRVKSTVRSWRVETKVRTRRVRRRGRGGGGKKEVKGGK